MTALGNTRIWYIVKKPGEGFSPPDLKTTARDAWNAWLKAHPVYVLPASHDITKVVSQAMSLAGVRLCTVNTVETGVISGSGLG